jgi:hypothetical protein
MVIKAALTISASTKAMVQAAIVLPDRGLPAIMAQLRCCFQAVRPPRFPSQKIINLKAKTRGTPSRDEVPGLQIAQERRNTLT